MSYDYSLKNYNPRLMARAVARDLPVSRKQSVEICNFIRNRELNKAKNILLSVIEKKRAIPYRRYNMDLGHKKKIGPGSYPIKATSQILKLIENVESNAQFKGLNTANLYIRHIIVNQGGKVWHYGRKTRRRMKRAHIEIVVGEKTKND